MKINEVRDAMYQELTPHLPGWKLVKKQQGFVRTIDGGDQRIVIDAVDYRPEYRVTLTFVTRLDAVEAVFHRATGTPPSQFGFTAATQLVYFFPGESPPKQFKVHDRAEIAAAMNALAPVLRERALPLMDRTRTVEELDAAMNGDDRAFDMSALQPRVMHGLIVAHFARNPRFDDLVRRYQAEMSAFSDAQKQCVADLVIELTKDPP